MNDAHPRALSVEAELARHGEREVTGPGAIRHEPRRAAEDHARRTAFEGGLADLVLLAQQVAAVEIDAVGDAAALEHPPGRITRRLDIAAVHVADAVLTREARRAAGPEQQTGETLGAAGAGRGGGGARRRRARAAPGGRGEP